MRNTESPSLRSSPGACPHEPVFGCFHNMNGTGIKPAATIAVLFAVVVSLAAADRFLADVESAEVKNTAQRSYLTGSRLLEAGKPGDAIAFLRDAHALARQNPEYELQLITALVGDGKITEAEPLLTDILQRETNDGRTNLIAARLMIRKGDTAEAEAYYHRAIYGQWPGNQAQHRVSARMELIDLLVEKNQKQELLAELISLEAEPGVRGEVQARLGQLFLLADAPARAAVVYQALIDKNPKDIADWEGLGDAELEQGRYRAAHDAYLRAFMRDPNNVSVRAHLETLNTVTGLDPTLRQLTSAEKFRRSVNILEMARTATDQCMQRNQAANPALNSDENRQLLMEADKAIASQTPANVTNEAAEGVLSLAEKVWHAETNACVSKSSEQNALDLIMKKLTAT